MSGDVFRVRDPIHGFVRLDGECAQIVDTPVLQRLRGIRQLALASYVYPGALHTRFDHTLGVTHVARTLAKMLNLDPQFVRLVTLAALLHDAGHGPFSHVSERSLSWFCDPPSLRPGQSEHKIHEVVTAAIIRQHPSLAPRLSEDDREQIIQLLNDWDGPAGVRQVISGPLDADKQDYLLRDSYFCGVQYGVFDLNQFHRSLKLPDPNSDLMIDEDGIAAVEQFVLAKYYMTSNVYRHRVRIISDQMITRAIRLGVEVDKLPEMNRLFRYDGTGAFIDNYLRWDDSRFFETFCPFGSPPPGAKSGAMLQRFRERRLLKEVFRDRIGRPYDARHFEMLKGLDKRASSQLAVAVERQVAEFLNSALGLTGDQQIDPDFVIAHSYGIKSARESSRNDEQGILVDVQPNPQPFTDISTLFRSINEAYADNHLVILAPVNWPDSKTKTQQREDWKPHIQQIIMQAAREVRK